MKKIRRFSMIFIWSITFQIILLTGITFAAPVEEWNRTFAREKNESGITNILPTRDAGFISTGSAPYEIRFVNYCLSLLLIRSFTKIIIFAVNNKQSVNDWQKQYYIGKSLEIR